MKLKGHTIIELTDVNTGAVEQVESDNMFTNALQQIFDNLVGLNSNSLPMPDNTDTLKLATSLLGGLLLFDTALDENPNNVFAPAGTRMVGCASYNSPTYGSLQTTHGSYNATESVLNEGYVKFVYDFTTSQANGTIASVCLTSIAGGFGGYGVAEANTGLPAFLFFWKLKAYDPFSKTINNASIGNHSIMEMGKEVPFCYDSANSVLYCAVVTKEMITINTYDYYNNIHILRPVKYKKQLESYSVNLTSAFTKNYYMVSYNSDEQTLYFLEAGSANDGMYMANGTSKMIYALNLKTKALSSHTFTNRTNVSIYLPIFTVHNGFLYALSNYLRYDVDKVYKIDLSSSSFTVISFDPIQKEYVYKGYGIRNGLIYFNFADRMTIIDTVSERVFMTRIECGTTGSSQVYSYDSNHCIAMDGYVEASDVGNTYYNSSSSRKATSNCVAFGNYLATINNLETPIVKTADKTMKVTYIIEEQEGNA